MAIISFVILTVCPGAWVTFGLPLDELSWRVRLALAAALSPAILGLQLFLAGLAGLPFGKAAIVILVVNTGSLVVMWRGWRKSARFQPGAKTEGVSPSDVDRTVLLGALLIVLLLTFLVVPWLANSNYRVFSWHTLLHTDIIYQLTRGNLLPEEPEMAGLRLSYTWVGDAYWAILGWMTDSSPSSLYPVTNAIWLLVSFFLAYSLASDGLGLRRGMALVSVAVLFLGTNAIGACGWLLANNRYQWSPFLGDTRYTPLLRKYQGFETMPFAFALLLGLALICVIATRRNLKGLNLLVPSLLAAVGLIYPILFPMGVILAGALLVLLASGWTIGRPRFETGKLVLLTVGVAAGCVLFVLYLWVVVQDRSGASFQLAYSGRITKSLNVISALSPLVLAALPAIVRALRERRGEEILLAVTGFCLMGLYVLTTASRLEYKFILGATIALSPLSAAGIEYVCSHRPRLRTAIAIGAPATLAVIYVLFMFKLQAGMPTNIATAPQITEDSFWIQLKSANADSGWTSAIHKRTPPDTIVIARSLPFHLGPFVARSLYMPSDANGEATAGYSMDNRFNLLEYRGYSPVVYAERLRLQERLFEERDPHRLAAVLNSLKTLRRPLAIRFRTADRPFALEWLRDEQIGSQLFSDDQNVVWFIDRENK